MSVLHGCMDTSNRPQYSKKPSRKQTFKKASSEARRGFYVDRGFLKDDVKWVGGWGEVSSYEFCYLTKEKLLDTWREIVFLQI